MRWLSIRPPNSSGHETADSRYLAIPFYMTAAAAYGLGLPFAAGVQLAMAALAHPLGRATGFVGEGMEVPWQMIGVETACLIGLGYMALRGPMIFTRRPACTGRPGA